MYQTSVGKQQHRQGNKQPPGIMLCSQESMFWGKKADLYAFLSFIWEEVPSTSRVTEVTQKQNFTCG